MVRKNKKYGLWPKCYQEQHSQLFSRTVIEGEIPKTMSDAGCEAEREKKIGAMIRSGSMSIILDNIKGKLDSPVIEKCITDRQLSFRLLGTSELIQRPNDVLFMGTANGAKLSRDMIRRVIPINLKLDADPNMCTYPISDFDNFVLDHRESLISELIRMIDKWIRAGKPLENAKHSVNEAWAKTIDGILVANGIEGFLSNMSEAILRFDVDREVLTALFDDLGEKDEFSSLEAANALSERGILTKIVSDKKVDSLSDKSKETRLGTFLSNNIGRVIENDTGRFRLTRFGSTNTNHNRRYGFEQTPEESAA